MTATTIINSMRVKPFPKPRLARMKSPFVLSPECYGGLVSPAKAGDRAAPTANGRCSWRDLKVTARGRRKAARV